MEKLKTKNLKNFKGKYLVITWELNIENKVIYNQSLKMNIHHMIISKYWFSQ
jgi:hypothetical protein